jgi:hypothetical protein
VGLISFLRCSNKALAPISAGLKVGFLRRKNSASHS